MKLIYLKTMSMFVSCLLRYVVLMVECGGEAELHENENENSTYENAP